MTNDPQNRPVYAPTAGGPAFPEYKFVPSMGQMMPQAGMTLRDYFAAKAIEGSAYNLCDFRQEDQHRAAESYAKAAYMVADAMLAERAK